MSTSMHRRDSLRLALLGLAAVAGTGVLAGCTADQEPRQGDGDDTTPPDGEIQLVSSDVKRAAGDVTLVPDVVAGLQSLAGGLYGGVATRAGNVVLSPYSVLVALGMTMVGAGGRTAAEMTDVVGAADLGERWHQGVNALTAHVDGLAGKQQRADDSTAEIALATTNQLFGQQDVAWEQDFLDVLAKEYGAGVRAVDFESAPEQARQLINAWVAERTKGRIEDLVPEGVLDAMTRLVLVNAIYLKAPWEQPFEKELTSKAPFRLGGGGTVEVDMMHRPDLSGVLVAGDGWRAARIGYAGRRLAMTVVLPDAGGLDAAEESLTASGFGAVTTGGQPAVVDLRLPRWTFRTQASLADLLKDLGMPVAFEPGSADFTAMTVDDLPLHIGAVLHQGFIAVDEEGTEAAAATAVSMSVTSAPVAEPFVVDRPFLFVIHDVEHGTPLFVGRVSDPTA